MRSTVDWRNRQYKQTPKTVVIKHKMSGLITRLFCAECLPFLRTANYGCYFGHRLLGPK